MSANFPTSLDSLTNPEASSKMDDAGLEHDVQHSNLNDIVEAIEAKLGIDNSEDTNSIDYRLAAVEAALGGSGDPWDDEFEAASFDTDKWAWVNQQNTTVAQSRGCAVMSMPDEKMSLLVQAISGTSWRVEAKVWAQCLNSRWPYFGLAAYETSSGNIATAVVAYRSHLSRWTRMSHGIHDPFDPSITFDGLGSETNLSPADNTLRWAGPYYLAIERNGSNMSFEMSNAPTGWMQIGSLVLPGGTLFDSAPDKVGMYLGGADSATKAIFEYIRKVS
jgi:hypothetical protein